MEFNVIKSKMEIHWMEGNRQPNPIFELTLITNKIVDWLLFS